MSASFWDRVRAALKREKHDLDEWNADVTARGNAALDEKERELNATPEEKLQVEQERIARNDDEFEAVRRRIEERGGTSS
jgi:hypothetical protein